MNMLAINCRLLSVREIAVQIPNNRKQYTQSKPIGQ